MKQLVYTNDNPSIVFMLTSFDYGGAQTQVINLASILKRRGWSVKIISMLPPKAFSDKLQSLEIGLATLNMRRGVPDPRAIIRLVSLLYKWRPTVFHCHMVHANLLGRVARIFTSVPVMISSAHNINEGGRAIEVAYRITDSLTDVTTNVSQAAVDRFIENNVVPQNRIRVMRNGIDISRYCVREGDRERNRKVFGFGEEFVWIAIGRIEEAKDYPNMLRAFKKVVSERNARLIILGEGPLMDSVKEEAINLGIQKRVQMLGNRDDVPTLLNAADGYVMSSAWEGLPIVLLEAAAAKLPIVCTDVGGNAEVVLNNKNGYVVPPHDSSQLSEAMLKLMDLPESDLEYMGQAGHDYVEKRFSLENITDQWECIYRELLSEKEVSLPILPQTERKQKI